MNDFLNILGRAAKVAGVLTLLVAILLFMGALVTGDSGAGQAPLLAVPVFILVFPMTMVMQIRRALRLSIGWKIAYFVLLSLSLFLMIRIASHIPSLVDSIVNPT